MAGRRPYLIPVLVAVGVLVIAGVIVSGFLLLSGPDTLRVKGSLELVDDTFSMLDEGDSCTGLDGYDDIYEGTQVAISDPAGKVLAIGELQAGTMHDTACVFRFNVADVPTGHKIYGIEVSHRGVVKSTEEELRTGPDLSLGS